MSTGLVALLFRRRCGDTRPKHFVATLVADASEDAVELLEKAKLPLLSPMRLQVTYGPHDGAKQPKYFWVRIETVVLSENVRIPGALCRPRNGLLKPRYI